MYMICLSKYVILRAALVGVQDLFGKLKEGMDPGFRLFITALPNDEFPLGLLQMCTKVCVEGWEEEAYAACLRALENRASTMYRLLSG